MQAPAPAAAMASVSTPQDARKLADGLFEAMRTLLALLEHETHLVRNGRIEEAVLLEPRKAELSRLYLAGIALVKASQAYMTRATPELLAALHRHHDSFRAMLQVNLTVLATAHAVSEGVIRGVNREMQRRNAPQTYTAAGQRAMPGPRAIAPISVSRSL